MKFDKFIPSDELKPFIKYFVVSENSNEQEYRVLPSSGMVAGFQYTGRLSIINEKGHNHLSSAGITGLADRYKVFRASANIGTLLIYFTETGFSNFVALPASELFNQSISLHEVFYHDAIDRVEEKLAEALTDQQRISIVEKFLLSQLKTRNTDLLIAEAVNLINQSNGNIRISELNRRLFISQRPLEKRFKKIVGTTPKKFASLVRFNTILKDLDQPKSLVDICYDNNYFDQAHFIKDFKQFTGSTPEKFKRFL